MAGDLKRAQTTVESQPVESFKVYKEEYIQALCKQIAVYSLIGNAIKVNQMKEIIQEMDTSEYAANSLVKRWMKRVGL